jgi:mono/diheme cytochrome c family protein
MFSRLFSSVGLLTALTLPAGATLAADIAAGEQLHAKHCGQCHGTEVYTREDRKMNDYAALEQQVRRCEQNIGLKWFEEDVENVAAYLNQTYYKFDKP